jgi:hypothetical protein
MYDSAIRVCQYRCPPPAGGPNDVWGMDFVADQLADGRKPVQKASDPMPILNPILAKQNIGRNAS